MGSRQDLIQRLRQFIAKLGVPVSEAYLFGSRASGSHLESSDVDIVLVSPQFASMGFFERPVEIYRHWSGPESLEPLCYTPEEFEKKKGQISIVREAVRTGIRIPLA